MADRSDLLRTPLDELMAEARRLRADATGALVTYSPKVFVPLTTLCRDVCGYCTFARPPRRGEQSYLAEDEVLAIASAGAAAGCTEALFTLGDRPEARYRAARAELVCSSDLRCSPSRAAAPVSVRQSSARTTYAWHRQSQRADQRTRCSIARTDRL